MDKPELDDESKKALGPEHLGKFSRFLKAEEGRGTLNTEEKRRQLSQDIARRMGWLLWVILFLGMGIGFLLGKVIF